MAELNSRPAIFALSNPTSRAECTAEQAYAWTRGRAIFASGSPFTEVEVNGKMIRPGQGNNVYIFPAVGLGAAITESSRISEDMFLTAAQRLSELIKPRELEKGTIYPPLNEIRDVTLELAVAVAEQAYKQNLANIPKPDNLRQAIAAYMYDPTY